MNILVAEDDDSLRLLLTELLEEMGHEVKSAENGAELVKLALAGRPHLVITDLHMPQMSGGSMIAMLDMYPDLSGIPVVIITGATRSELADMGIPGEIPILAKPFNFENIRREVDRVRVKLDL